MSCRICSNITYANKPFCPQHITEMPYVKNVFCNIENYDTLQLENDIKIAVTNRPTTFGGIHHCTLSNNLELIKKICKKLIREKFLTSFVTSRGFTIYKLSKKQIKAIS